MPKTDEVKHVARPCAFCGMPYIEPCDGQNHKCGNYPLAEERHNTPKEEDPMRLGPTPTNGNGAKVW